MKLNKNLKFLLPVGVILISILGALVIVGSRPDVKPQPASFAPKIVKVLQVHPQNVQLTVKSQGSVRARTESGLVSQVAGLVTSVAPSFVAGGFFEKGDILISLDPRDYEFALTQAKYQVAKAELAIKIEEQQAEVAREEWQRLNSGNPPSLVSREPQLLEASAALNAAKAGQQLAQLNLERTMIRAPYAGRVRTKNADVGQYVTPGMTLAGIYAIDYAEVRLPIRDDDLAFLDMPYDFRGARTTGKGPEVVLLARFAGRKHEWHGYLTHIEAEVESRSRMIHAVARIENPYGKSKIAQRPPLTVGLFVDAEISGKTLKDVFVIPRSALRNLNQVLVIDDSNRLRFRQVELYRVETDKIYLRSGLTDGEVICISVLEAVVDGMPVEPLTENNHSNN